MSSVAGTGLIWAVLVLMVGVPASVIYFAVKQPYADSEVVKAFLGIIGNRRQS